MASALVDRARRVEAFRRFFQWMEELGALPDLHEIGQYSSSGQKQGSQSPSVVSVRKKL